MPIDHTAHSETGQSEDQPATDEDNKGPEPSEIDKDDVFWFDDGDLVLRVRCNPVSIASANGICASQVDKVWVQVHRSIIALHCRAIPELLQSGRKNGVTCGTLSNPLVLQDVSFDGMDRI